MMCLLIIRLVWLAKQLWLLTIICSVGDDDVTPYMYPDLQKAGIILHFKNQEFVSWCSRCLKPSYQVGNINRVWLTRLSSKRSNIPFVCIPMAIKINYTIITCEHFSVQSWDKHHCTQDKLGNPLLHSFMPKIQMLAKEKYNRIASNVKAKMHI